MAEPTGPFAQAYETVDAVELLVSSRIADATALAGSLRTSALEAFTSLSDFTPDYGLMSPPSAPTGNVVVSADFDLPGVNATSFGTISEDIPAAPSLDAVPGIGGLTIPDFVTMITGLSIPDAPAPMVIPAVPSAPVTGSVTIPDAPTVDLPPLPTLEDLTIPAFVFPTMPSFDAAEPEFVGTAVSNVLQWGDPQYSTVVIDDVVATLRDMWSGRLGLPEAVEQAMWERASSREDLATSRAISEVMIDFSSRGFALPPGMLVARVDAIYQEAVLKKLGLNRELTIQIAQWQIENVRLAVEQAIAAENVFVNIFQNMAQRQFDAAKTELMFGLDVYNAQVALFNARQGAYGVAAEVFKTQITAAMSQIDIFKAQIEGEVARGQLNESRVRAYSATVEAVKTHVEIYKAKMDGAKVQSDVIRNQIEAYRAEVQAFGEQVQAEKTVFDAYKARVDGEAAKAGIIDAEAKAYAALIQGRTAVADIDAKRAELVVQKNRQAIEAYSARLQASQASISAQQASIQVAAQAYIADTQRFAAVAGAEGEKARAEIAGEEATVRAEVARYEALSRSYIGHMEQMIRKAQLQLEALVQASQVASTLAAGAMAGVNVGANLSGSGAVGASGTVSETHANTVGYSYSGDVAGDVPPKTTA